MLYLLFVLTFLAGILFYGMSPRDDKLQMDVHQAEGMILSFVSQHQAAKDYVYTWLGVGPVGSNVLANGFLHPNFENMMWGKGNFGGINPEVCDGNNGVPGFNSCQNEDADQIPGFVSRVICVNKCVDPAAAAAASPCALNDEDVVNCDSEVPAGRSRRSYVITYGGWQNCNGDVCTRPDWWPTQGQRMRKFESWRKAISKRTRNSASCGFLFSTDDDHPTDSTWCIDNGETAYERDDVCQNPVPPSLIGQLRNAYGLVGQNYSYLYDLLFCYSGFRQGIPGHYASGVRYFYDGISNTGPGQHTAGGNWQNLAGHETMTTTLTDHPYIERDSELDTEIVLGASYTLTIILTYTRDGGAPGNNNVGAVFDIFRIPEEASDTTEPQKIAKRIFQKTNAHEQFQTNFSDGSNFLADACNGATKTGEGDARGIISWTFVVNGQKMKVYENATLTPFGTDNVTTIVNTNGKQLIIGPATEGNAHIYGIRYYPGTQLTQEEIAQNFKADQKRFGIPDRNNGKQIGHPDIDGGTIYCSGACASDLRGNGWQNDPRMDGRPVDEGGCGVAGP